MRFIKNKIYSKKIVAALLCINMLTLCVIPAGAEQCDHSYTSEFFEATCTSKAHTVYTCSICQDTYTLNEDEYMAPDGVYLVCSGEREQDRIGVSIYLYNNPGIEVARLIVYFNNEVVIPVSFENGEVWSQNEYINSDMVTLDPLSDHITLYNESSTDSSNTKNGLYCRITFDIIGALGPGDIRLTYPTKGFVEMDQNNMLVEHRPSVFNLVGKGLLKDHTWEFDRTLKDPDFENSGEEMYCCNGCGDTYTVEIPPLEHWMKGDLDNNMRVNGKDSFILKKVLLGDPVAENRLQVEDAADINRDGKLNLKDSFCIKLMLLGMSPNEE